MNKDNNTVVDNDSKNTVQVSKPYKPDGVDNNNRLIRNGVEMDIHKMEKVEVLDL